MLRLVKSVEERPEHSTVINWTVPVYIKNGEDYYKVCFDIKRKPLPDGTLPLTDEEKKEFKKLVNIAEDEFFERADLVKDHIQIWWRTKHCSWRYDELRSIKAILWLAERFDLTSNN